MSTVNEDLVRLISSKVNVPLIFREFLNDRTTLCHWSLEKWCSVFGNREIPFRCMKKNFLSDEPCWERMCNIKKMTFKSFVDASCTNKEWMYFDYKYLHQWFVDDTEFCKELLWKHFGYPDKGAADTTLWAGSSGAHTPAHQDIYGVNIVAQLYGRKRWILFNPDTDAMRPTRIPYEESSVYSELNFYCPHDLDVFKGLTGARVVELQAGDALFVPQGWWHYVQNMDPVNIAVNMWLPHEKDGSARVSEALIKILVAQICKDLPQDTAQVLLNPNEDDISETPLAVLFLQLDTVAKSYLDTKRKTRRMKRQKTCVDNPDKTAETEEFDLKILLENKANNLDVPKVITNEELLCLLKENIRQFTGKESSINDDDVDGSTSNLRLTKAVIDAFSQRNVIDIVKQNLFDRFS